VLDNIVPRHPAVIVDRDRVDHLSWGRHMASLC
jgi:hypothetical protein